MQFTAMPQNEQELLSRCHQIAGKTIAELATNVPKTLLHSKGFIGQLIEFHLGAQSKNLPVPDFVNLGIELKTLPINEKGQPLESTFVCTAPLPKEKPDIDWPTSRVYQKLKRVLWVPIVVPLDSAIHERRVANAILWSPDSTTEAILRTDWEDLMEMLVLGQISKLSAHFGTYLQIRPKAAHSRILQAAINENGEKIWTGPKGFYLRTKFTQKIMNENYC